jgi:hypothetical protein
VDRRLVGRILKRVIDIDRHASEIVDELKLVPERIVGDKPATYERWDRLRAEGEFRQGVVPPLLAIIAILAIRGVDTWPFALLLVLLPLLILFQGIGKDNAAEAQLMQTIEANVIQIDPVERLATSKLYWRVSSSSDGPTALGSPRPPEKTGDVLPVEASSQEDSQGGS